MTTSYNDPGIPNWITPEVEYLLLEFKSKVPTGFTIDTIERHDGLVLEIKLELLNQFNVWDKVKIAEGVNELCSKIRAMGCPCGIQKV